MPEVRKMRAAAAAEVTLAAIDVMLEETGQEIAERLLALRDQGAEGLGDYRKRMAELRDLMLAITQERARLDKLMRSEGAVIGQRNLDLQRARDEIEDRLARLGQSAREGEVPVQPG